ncbi:alpha-galactosidase [Bifidobacterium catenulatum]|uniref:Alpha-galactosidase n=1 Tax=Bifidobacterium catenulatum TaxID=1686 RepID=A0A1V8PLN9_9BIFI|nr:glycoside hydrolase family 36 protein [Bifidobacterium catenulatum]OQM49540.1 alpha-galactosidase [Bifidobacterium catenulatum]
MAAGMLNPLLPRQDGRLEWGNGVVSMLFDIAGDSPVRLCNVVGRGMIPIDGRLSDDGTPVVEKDPRPIVEVLAANTGSQDNRLALIATVAGSKLRFVSALASEPGQGSADPFRLEITQFASYADLEPKGREFESTASERDVAASAANPAPVTVCADPHEGLVVTSVFEAFPNLSAVRTHTRLQSAKQLPIEAVSSLNLTVPMRVNCGKVHRSNIFWGDAAWAVENDWRVRPLRDTQVRNRNQKINPGQSSSRFAMSSTSTWSTGVHEPAGIVQVEGSMRRARDFSVMWQIEHNGPWEWEVGEDDPGLHISAFGPEYQNHGWFTNLGEGNDFESVPVSFAIAAGDWQQAVAEMTLQRRALRVAKARELGRAEQFKRTQGLVVYNDYMNTLFGDPRIEKELPLIEGAASVGADIFCIDAGWYDSTDGGWWDMVGEWQASTNRFGDAGLRGLAENIRAHGMGLGLWLEPEVIGAKSPLASTLPDSAFFQRHGVRVCDSGRYLLDFRSPEAREHVTRTVDRLIDDFGAVFFKFDYNTIPGVGTDLNTESVGDGLLEHCRAYLDWLDDLRRRHPDVMIENCGSGAMRADYAQLSRLDLQSTSDQCDPLIYAAIAAGAGMTILPEQQGNWGYAQQEMDDETAVFTLATGVLGRLYLSGFVDRMTEPRLSLVRDAIALHRCVLADQQHMVPFWPSGLPDFDGDWLTVGLRHVETDMCDEHVLGCGVSNGQNADSSNRQNDQQIQQEDKPDYIIVWRRGGTPSVNIPLEAGRTIEQVFPNPDEPDHAPDAEPWTIERMDPETVRLNATTSKRPSARIFAIRRRG